MLYKSRLSFRRFMNWLSRIISFFLVNGGIVCDLADVLLGVHWLRRNVASYWVFFQLNVFLYVQSVSCCVVVLFFMVFLRRFILLYLWNHYLIFLLFAFSWLNWLFILRIFFILNKVSFIHLNFFLLIRFQILLY
jgi:hypothetical protein